MRLAACALETITLVFGASRPGVRGKPEPQVPRLSPLRYAELRQLRGDVPTSSRRLDVLIDVHDRSIRPNVERPARCHPDYAKYAVRFGCFLRLIGKDGVVGADVLGKLLIGLRVVDANCEVGDIECTNRSAALTERLALRGSSASERFWEPRQNDGALASKITQRVGFTVGALEAERRRGIADLQVRGLLRESEQTGRHADCD